MKLKSRLATLFVTAVGVTALFGLASGSALAAHWNIKSMTVAHWKGSLTVSEAGGSSVTCSNLDLRIPTYNNEKWGTAEYWTIYEAEPVKFACAGGTNMELGFEGQGILNAESKYELRVWGLSIPLESPVGGYMSYLVEGSEGIVTNGTEKIPSQITFSNDVVGELIMTGAPIVISGTLSMTTATGGLLKLEP